MNISEILKAFPKLPALVVGDICLDRWCTYDPKLAEPSRETGIPRIGVVSVEVTPGAGGTVANNLAALGVGRVAVLGVIGNDGFGFELKQALRVRGMEPEMLVETPGLQTFTYTKVINSETGVEDYPRLDFVSVKPLAAKVEEELVRRLNLYAPEFEVILVSDQAETDQGGVVTARLREALADLARKNPRKVVWVDSRMRPELFRGVIVKPNEDEARAAVARLHAQNYRKLFQTIQGPLLLVTHGGEGVLVMDEVRDVWVKTTPVSNPVDICGAGDSFSAGAACAFAVTRDAEESARFGNMVASITIMKKGTGTASPAELLAKA
jgi:rfaE bifunctional protein kinase chain/domain